MKNVFRTAEHHVTDAPRNLWRGPETPQLPWEFAKRVELFGGTYFGTPLPLNNGL